MNPDSAFQPDYIEVVCVWEAHKHERRGETWLFKVNWWPWLFERRSS